MMKKTADMRKFDRSIMFCSFVTVSLLAMVRYRTNRFDLIGKVEVCGAVCLILLIYGLLVERILQSSREINRCLKDN